MRFVPFILTTFITILLIFVLDRKWGEIPPLGRFVSPQHGFWQNADPADEDFNMDLSFPQLKGKVNVYFDERLVPHVFAENDEDMYFVQGYLHAKFRLWQMEFQTIAAEGRVSEVLGDDPRFIRFDREQRRMGMTFAAENALKEIEKDPISKIGCDAYTAGVNAYINSLTESKLPIEYKLLDYKPELWSNYRIALFLKQMSKTLAGWDNDLENTNAASYLGAEEIMRLDPQVNDSLVPIIPKGTAFSQGFIPKKPVNADSVYLQIKDSLAVQSISKPDPLNGSNNWAVAGSKTKSGSPILANDPHLELSFPSIWYEMQLNSPTVNAYGATFPGSPNVIIGYNDSIAFGFTNAQRDVKDYYEITFKDDTRKEYLFNGEWRKVQFRIEQIRIRGGSTLFDTVAYTHFGPVMYDRTFTNEEMGNRAIAVRWVAHEPSNEGLMWFKLNRAGSYDDYYNAIKDFTCPGQNMVFASRNGTIAIWQQAKFPARWDGQGLFLMPGNDTTYMWQSFIPQEDNPHVINPASGYIQSANQRPVDSTYPYFIPGNYITARGVAIDRRLSEMQQITPQDMMLLQNDTYSEFAADAKPLLLKNVDESLLNSDARKYLEHFRQWDLIADHDAKGATVFQLWYDSLETAVWADEMEQVKGSRIMPDEQTLLEALLRDSAYKYIDNIRTNGVESIKDIVTNALLNASKQLAKEEAAGQLDWTKHKNPTIYHLLKTIKPFSRKINAPGWSNTINATTHSHGPSWRMIVHMTGPIEAYGVYPGGQSGNPGSRFYESFVSTWEQGKYFPLWMMRADEAMDQRVKWKTTFTK